MSSGIDWKQFPPKAAPANPAEVAEIVSDDVDREYIFNRKLSLELLAKEESWSSAQLAKLTERGQIEVTVWLKEKNPQLQTSRTSTPRRSQETLCVSCKKQVAGYPGAPYSIFCSNICRKQNRIDRFGPIRAAAPVIDHPPETGLEVLEEPSEPSTTEGETDQAQLQSLLTEWGGKLTVQQLKALMAAQHITSQRKDLRKQDRVDLVVAHYVDKSWEQFKDDLVSIGCELEGIDSVE
jgi:hypothetical protein